MGMLLHRHFASEKPAKVDKPESKQVEAKPGKKAGRTKKQ